MNRPFSRTYPRVIYYALICGWLLIIGTSLLYPAYDLLIRCGSECANIPDLLTQLNNYPGIWGAAARSLLIGLSATALSFLLAVMIYASLRNTPVFKRLKSILSPILAIPHSAFALGMASLFAMNGFFARVGIFFHDGFSMPEWLLPYDRYGCSMVFALALRELPFILFLLMGNENHETTRRFVNVGYSLGYSYKSSLIKLWLPHIYPKIRFSLLIVLSFSVSVVDVGIILGPTVPPTLSVMILNFYKELSPAVFNNVYPAGILLFLTVCVAFFIWFGLEKTVSVLFRWYATNGNRRLSTGFRFALFLPVAVSPVVSYGIFLVLTLWMVAFRWRFPDIFPDAWTSANFTGELADVIRLSANSMLLALIVSTVSLIAAVCILELLVRYVKRPAKNLHVFYLTLIIPEIIIVTGLYQFSVHLNLDASYGMMVLFHTVFTLPYILLGLSGGWLQFNRSYTDVAETLGKGTWTVLRKIKIPMLVSPILYAWAIGYSVSISLYTPTIFSMRGRYFTLTTEAVALSSGGDMRVTSVYAIYQIIHAFIPFLFAYLVVEMILKKRQTII